MEKSHLSMLTAILSVLSLAGTAGCGGHKPQPSRPSYAHRPASEASAGPLGQLEALKRGWFHEKDRIDVCVQSPGSETLGKQEGLLEVQLAYASWLAATGAHEAADWKRFRFHRKSRCNFEKERFESFVFFVTAAQAEEGTIGWKFEPFRLECQKRSSNSYSCNTNRFTLGWAIPGEFQIEASSPNPRYVQKKPSQAFMSPYLDWLSLREELESQSEDALAPGARTALIETYESLLQEKPDTRSFKKLSGFVDSLRHHQVIGREDPVERRVMNSFQNSSKQSLDRTLTPRKAAFSTLIHEVGHQFGMLHAHAPSDGSLTGASPGAEKNDEGKWETSKACMAYGPDYLYTTVDDLKGQKNNFEKILDHLEKGGEG